MTVGALVGAQDSPIEVPSPGGRPEQIGTAMTTQPKRRAGVLTTVVTAVIMGLGIGTAPAALAADDCGYGFHFGGGACVVNLPCPGPALRSGSSQLLDQRPGRPALLLTPAPRRSAAPLLRWRASFGCGSS